MHLFDQLPTDMIHYEIFPYLDYDSRVTANLLLPQQDRMRVYLNKEAVLQFSMNFGMTILKPLVLKQPHVTNKITRARINLKIWRTLGKCPQLVQYHAKFRQIIINKIGEFTDPAMYETDYMSSYAQKAMIKLCSDFLERMETSLPYIREIKPSCFQEEDWSAVGTSR